MVAPDRVCVLRLSAIGDCCHALPVIRTLQKAWPETQITWIIGKTEHQLFRDIDDIDFVICDKSRGHRAVLDVRRQLRGRRFPILLNMHASMRANVASLAVRATRRIGYDRSRARDGQHWFTNERIPAARGEHVMEAMLGFARYLELAETDIRWDIPVSEADRRMAQSLRTADRPLVVISPCSSQRARNYRNWPAERYARVAETLQGKRGASIVLTGAPTTLEQEYGSEITRLANCPVTNLIGKTSLKQLLAILEAGDVLLCPDSGPAHMAGTVGTPVVGLYATSNPERTGPYFSKAFVVNKYPEALRVATGDSVADVRWGQRVRDPEAMLLIEVDEVIDALDRALDAAGPEQRPNAPSAVL